MHKLQYKRSLTQLKDAENHFTVDGLKEALMTGLALLQELKVGQLLILWPSLLFQIIFLQIPFVIPDADGTFQYTYSNCTVFGAPRKL